MIFQSKKKKKNLFLLAKWEMSQPTCESGMIYAGILISPILTLPAISAHVEMLYMLRLCFIPYPSHWAGDVFELVTDICINLWHSVFIFIWHWVISFWTSLWWWRGKQAYPISFPNWEWKSHACSLVLHLPSTVTRSYSVFQIFC